MKIDLSQALNAALAVDVSYELAGPRPRLFRWTTDTLCVSFYGTVTAQEWENDLRLALVPLKGDRDIKVHTGFKEMWEGAYERLAGLPDLRDPLLTKIVIVGHSLGAAMALLTAFSLRHDFPALDKTKIEVLAFGCPRVGNAAWKKAYNDLVPDTWRVIHDFDLVCRVPKWGYDHVGIETGFKQDGSDYGVVKGGWQKIKEWVGGFWIDDLGDHGIAGYVSVLRKALALR